MIWRDELGNQLSTRDIPPTKGLEWDADSEQGRLTTLIHHVRSHFTMVVDVMKASKDFQTIEDPTLCSLT